MLKQLAESRSGIPPSICPGDSVGGVWYRVDRFGLQYLLHKVVLHTINTGSTIVFFNNILSFNIL